MEHTPATVAVGISRVTPIVTVTRLFVTWRVVHTVTTAVVDTGITIGTVNTF